MPIFFDRIGVYYLSERQVNTVDVFEEQMYRKRRRQLRWFLCIPVLAALVIGIGIYVFTYHINRFCVEVTLQGDENILLEYGSSYAEPGAEAVLSGTWLLTDGVEIPVQIQGDVDETRVGTYEIRYTAQHERWKGEKIRTVQVVDTVEPRIWLAETPGSYVIPGQEYREQGFMARDNYDGDLTDQVVKTVLHDRIIYTVADSSGNMDEVERPIVYYDPVPPAVTLYGDTAITLAYGQVYEEPGYSAWDNCDGEITQKVSITGSVQSNRPGTYQLQYTVQDQFGNADTKIRTVTVKARKQSKPEQPEVIPDGKVIYLTFDDGPGQYTEKLLGILAAYDVKATFFVMNTGYTHLLDDIVSQGHSIAAHTYSHNYQKIYGSDEAYFADLERILNVIEKQTGVRTNLLRFPGGSSNTVSRKNPGIMSRLTNEVVNQGFRYFDWNVDSNDAGGARSSGEVYENVINGVRRQRVSVVLQHDIKGYSVNAVERIIQWGLENGYTFLPLQSDSPTAAHDVRN